MPLTLLQKLLHLAHFFFLALISPHAPASSAAMSPKRASAPRGKGKQAAEESSEPAVLGISRYRSEEAISKVRGLVGDAFSEWGTTEIRVGSDTVHRRSGLLQPVFVHALMAGLVPPFSSFLL